MRVVVGVDLSPGATRALRQADEYARASGTSLDVVSAWPVSPRHFPTAELAVVTGGDPRRMLELFRDHVRSLVSDRTGRDLDAFSVEVSRARPEHSLSEASRAHDCRLIAVGSRGGALRGRPLLGSVSAHVVRAARCPVLVARDGPPSGEVVVGVDLSPSTTAVVSWARDLATTRALGLTLVHAERDEGRRRAVAATLARLGDGLGASRTLCPNGAAAECVVRTAELLRAELIVIGATGERTRAGPLGGTAERIVRTASTSVVVVR